LAELYSENLFVKNGVPSSPLLKDNQHLRNLTLQSWKFKWNKCDKLLPTCTWNNLVVVCFVCWVFKNYNKEGKFTQLEIKSQRILEKLIG